LSHINRRADEPLRFAGPLPGLSRLLRIDDGESFENGDVAQPLVGAHELVDGC
jgi:hypothetical protein